MKQYKYQDKVFTFEGCVSVEVNDKWCKPWRIEHKFIEFFPYVWERAEMASGVRLVFKTDSENIGLKTYEFFEDMKLDLFVNGELFEKHICTDREIFFKKMDKDIKDIEIWLDPSLPFVLESVFIDRNASIQRIIDKRKRWVHYGSSISHSKTAYSPSTIWTGIVAQKFNMHLTNLGFGGNCILEPAIGMMIRDLKCDVITLKLGINCYNGSLSNRSFEPNAIGLIKIIRDKNPYIPVSVISPIYSPDKEKIRKRDNSLTLVEMRGILENVVEKFMKYGDKNITYINGLDILGPDQAGYMQDNVHPDADGQFVMAKNFINRVKAEKLNLL